MIKQNKDQKLRSLWNIVPLEQSLHWRITMNCNVYRGTGVRLHIYQAIQHMSGLSSIFLFNRSGVISQGF